MAICMYTFIRTPNSRRYLSSTCAAAYTTSPSLFYYLWNLKYLRRERDTFWTTIFSYKLTYIIMIFIVHINFFIRKNFSGRRSYYTHTRARVWYYSYNLLHRTWHFEKESPEFAIKLSDRGEVKYNTSFKNVIMK